MSSMARSDAGAPSSPPSVPLHEHLEQLREQARERLRATSKEAQAKDRDQAIIDARAVGIRWTEIEAVSKWSQPVILRAVRATRTAQASTEAGASKTAEG